MKIFLILLSLVYSTVKAADTAYLLKRLSPVPVLVNKSNDVKLDLNGSWYFNPSPKTGFENSLEINPAWKNIEVPGEWVMQGFKVEKNHWAGYSRNFTIPAGWKNKRVKLRCDGVYSESEIYVNGKKVGYHLGGFTPFEFDISDYAKPGVKSLITIKVKNEGIADSLASGSQYAVHPLGGITRKIYLVQMPDINVSMLHVSTDFDDAYQDANLKTELQIANESSSEAKNATLLFELLAPKSNEVVFSKKIDWRDDIHKDGKVNKIFNFPIQRPKKWDPEHPNLYTYRITLTNDKNTEVVERKIGFKEIEIRGNKIFVNNKPVKLRGACRHEIDPVRGRSLIGDEWMKDVLLFRNENVNYIRTSHYPPPEEFIEACDSLGMFVECEAPFCWADQTKVPAEKYKEAILDQTADMVNFFRSHVSILDWSIANESQNAYNEYFHKSADLVKELDPTRPRVYNQYGEEVDNKELELANFHYPGPDGPSRYQNNERPVVFNEYAHLNAYNRFELVTDPGLRDAWGLGFKNMWEEMYASPAIAGGCIWAGIDDTFILPDGSVVGYGTWGPIDDWRRQKPEYWHVKKTYSPVKIELAANYKDGQIPLTIENRMLFSNIDECQIKWRAGKFKGVIHPSIAQNEQKTIQLNIEAGLKAKDTLFIDVIDPRGVLVDQYAFNVIPLVKEKIVVKRPSQQIDYTRSKNSISARVADMQFNLNKMEGSITLTKGSSKNPFMTMGNLMVLPLNSKGNGTQMTGKSQVFAPFTAVAKNRLVKKVEYSCLPSKFIVTIYDDYEEGNGFTTYELNANKDIRIKYHYTINKAINPRQWGMVVSLANDFNQISWKRSGLWNYYPGGHIGRLSGTANAISSAPMSGPAGPTVKPTWGWELDRNELGTNDFRSTKMNIIEGDIIGHNEMVKIISDGSQSMRAWKDQEQSKLLIAGYSNLGGEGFFRGHAARFDKPLKQGDVIENTFQLKVE